MRIAFRADASHAIGTGHVMRCLALAGELCAGGAEVRFVCRAQPGDLLGVIGEAGHVVHALSGNAVAGELEDAAETAEALHGYAPDWLIVDHYGLGEIWERAMRGLGGRIAVLDDLANRSHDCDLLVDQNLAESDEDRYRSLVARSTMRLLGPRYALLRPEFRRARSSLRQRGDRIGRVLLFFGGVDATGETSKALDALLDAARADLHIDVVVGATNPLAQELRARCESRRNVSFHCQVANMAELMGAADFAFGAGGSTNWERCCVGLPTAVTVTAANQAAPTRALQHAGAVVAVGAADDVTARDYERVFEALAPEALARMRNAALAICDGRGAQRVTLALRREPLALRRARAEDAQTAWQWRNDQRTRHYSGDPAPIEWSAHAEWWSRAVADERRILLVASAGTLEVGVLRFDVDGSRAVVSIYLDPDLHGLGLGVSLLEAGMAWLATGEAGVECVEAVIHSGNAASRRAFEKAGFTRSDDSVWRRLVRTPPERSP